MLPVTALRSGYYRKVNRMKCALLIVTAVLVCFPLTSVGQNCCAPAVPQQGVLGETVALPQTLEISLHYEYLRSEDWYDGSEQLPDTNDAKAEWQRATLAVSYGILRRLGISIIAPYIWKGKSWKVGDRQFGNNTSGIGDITGIVRFSIIPRDFVNFRELSMGLGLKIPAGPTDACNFGWLLPKELQPGTGSWDYHGSLSFFQGFESVDFIVSATYMVTGTDNDYKFGNQFSYLINSSFHLHPRIDMSLGLSGIIRAKDKQEGEEQPNTGRSQIWLTPGLQVQPIPNLLRLHANFEIPIYQHFNGIQLAGDFNIRLTASFMIPLKKSAEEE